jgi:hypothetical protein
VSKSGFPRRARLHQKVNGLPQDGMAEEPCRPAFLFPDGRASCQLEYRTGSIRGKGVSENALRGAALEVKHF